MAIAQPRSDDAWVTFGDTRQAEVTLVCLPYAGGSAVAAFARVANHLPPPIQLCAVELPGRGRRIREPPVRRLVPLAREIAATIARRLEVPFALYGYSMGALLGFEVARALRDAGGPAPLQLIAAASRAPQWPMCDPPVHALDDAAFLAEINSYGGTPPEALESEQVMNLYLPPLRADFEAAETYRYEPGEPLEVPISVLGGLDDRMVERASLRAWRHQTVGTFALELLPGDHFFMKAAPARVARAVAALLQASP